MQTHEILAWLGDDQGALTGDQLAAFTALAEQITARHPGPDDRDDAQGALTVAHRLLLEQPESVVADLARDLLAARRAEAVARAGLRQAALQLIEGVYSEARFAREAGVDRMTVRSWRRT